MAELTLEELAKRIDAIERRLQSSPPPRPDWRSALGMFAGSEFMKEVDAAGQAIRQHERDESRREVAE